MRGLAWLVPLGGVAFLALEVVLLVRIGNALGVLAVLGLLVLAGVAGMAAIRHAVASFGRDFGRGMPADPASVLARLGHAGLLILAGLLLAVPGFAGDGLGLLLLLPPVRALVLKLVGAAFVARFAAARMPGGGIVVEGVWQEAGGIAPGQERLMPGERP
jgi:UPF0716 protein FxsA